MLSFQYRCSECAAAYVINPSLMVCPKCSVGQKKSDPLHGVLDVELSGELGRVSGELNRTFRVFDLLPVEKRYFPEIPVGDTALWKVPNLRKQLKFKNLFVKNDGALPTCSFKDRASYLVAAFARQHKIKEIVLASTGNAASSMAGVGAAAGLGVTIFLPKTAPQAKMAQSLQYGAKLYLVDGNYDMAYDLSLEYSAQKPGSLSRNTAYNPMTIEGKKTVSLEVFKQLKKAPDHVFVSAGDGVILSGVYKGFLDLKKLGLIANVPTLHAIQAEGSSALYRAFKNGVFDFQPSTTVADSISVDVPRNGYHALKNLKTHHGQVHTVSDGEILEAQKLLSSSSGLFTEPAGACALAGFLKVKATLDPKSTVVILTTGNGLKDVPSALKICKIPTDSIRSIESII